MNVPLTHASSLPPSPSTPRPRGGDLKLAAFLGLASVVGFALVVPYSNTLLPAMRLEGLVVPVAAVAQGAFLLFLAWAGLRMGRSFGLDAPLLRGVSARETGAWEGARTARSLAGAMAAGALVVGTSLLLSHFVHLPAVEVPHAPRWMGLLASFGAPLMEEIRGAASSP